MSNVGSTFKATHPQTIADWHAQREADREQFTRSCKSFAAEYGRDSMIYRLSGFADSYTAFAVGLPGGGEVPAGWRKDAKTGYIVPAKRTEEGKRIAERINALHYLSYLPGLPQVASNETDPATGEGLIGGFAIEHIGDDWYATLSFEPDNLTLNQIDAALWQRVPLSQFHAAQEAQQPVTAGVQGR